jgi:uncharacterized membrane protein
MGRMAAMRSRPQVGDDVSTSRLESFSDGVIAIIVTIMVLVVRYATHVTPALLWLNMATLFTISLIPFATAWLGAHLVAPLPNVVYGLVLIASAVSFLLLSEVVNRQNAAHREYAHVILIARAKGLIALALYVTGVALAALVPGALLFAAGAAALMYFVPTAAPKVKPP